MDMYCRVQRQFQTNISSISTEIKSCFYIYANKKDYIEFNTDISI